MKTYQEAIEHFGLVIGEEIFDLYMSGAMDTRVSLDRYAETISFIYGLPEDDVLEDLQNRVEMQEQQLRRQHYARVNAQK